MGYALGGARILDHVIQTGTDGVEAAITNLTDPNRQKKFPTDEEVAEAAKKASKTDSAHVDAVKTFGLACGKRKLEYSALLLTPLGPCEVFRLKKDVLSSEIVLYTSLCSWQR